MGQKYNTDRLMAEMERERKRKKRKIVEESSSVRIVKESSNIKNIMESSNMKKGMRHHRTKNEQVARVMGRERRRRNVSNIRKCNSCDD